MSPFTHALQNLPESLRQRVEACFQEWVTDHTWNQISANIRGEYALDAVAFTSLLHRFAEELLNASAPVLSDAKELAWCKACQQHTLRGAEVPRDKRPVRLGRAWRVQAFANSVSQASGHLTPHQAERMLRSHSGRPLPARAETQIRASYLGGAIIWATFNLPDTNKDPFSVLPRTAAAITCALGLGYHLDTDIAVIIYGSSEPSHGQPLYRPTIADAGSYSFFRPSIDPSAYHGYTKPLDPNINTLPPMPEVVHAQITGTALIIPYYIFG